MYVLARVEARRLRSARDLAAMASLVGLVLIRESLGGSGDIV